MSFALSDLETIVARRASADGDTSYTARLSAAGIGKASQKFGEEAVETIVAALSEDGEALTKEAADVLYHLLVVLRLRGVPLSDVMSELERRTAETGLQEKARRASTTHEG